MRELADANLGRQEQRILGAITGGRRPSPELRLAVHGWLAFLVSVVLDWLDDPSVERAAIADLAVRAFDALVALTPEANAR